MCSWTHGCKNCISKTHCLPHQALPRAHLSLSHTSTKGIFFSWACCLAKTGLNGAWAPLAADGALDGGGESVVLGGIGGEALDGAFLPFLWPLPPPLADWGIPFLVWWLSLQSSPQIHRNALGIAWKQWIAFKSPSPAHKTQSQPIASLQMTKRKTKNWIKTNPAVFFRRLRVLFLGHVAFSCPTRFFHVSCFRIRLKDESGTCPIQIVSDSIPTGHEGPSRTNPVS